MIATNLEKLNKILSDLGFLFTETRTDFTYAYDFVRSKSKANLSRSDVSRFMRLWSEESGANLDDARFLLTICYVFDSNLTNVPLSKLVAFTQLCATEFNLTQMNGGTAFDFDDPKPAFLTELCEFVEQKL